MLLLMATLFSVDLLAQNLPVGGMLGGLEDALRRQQLLGLDSSHTSFMIRPLSLNNEIFKSDSAHTALSKDFFRKQLYRSSNNVTAVYLLPAVMVNQFNSHHPYGTNDGSMIPNRGFQTQVSVGLFAKLGPLSVQLRPEFVFAENKNYRGLSQSGSTYAGFYNRIDLPERYGEGAYHQLNWGQSSIRLTFDPISIGLSNENLWWGPGVNNSLLMSNNAAGFKHLTLNTSRPIRTIIGAFETQVVAGRLEGSGYELKGTAYRVKPTDWRYFSAATLTYQPKWVPNLYLGLERSFYVYRKDMERTFKGYFPIFSGALKEGVLVETENASEEKVNQDQYFSAYARWVWPESKAELYFQFGRNDFSYNLRDLVIEPENSRAYIAGLRKLIPLTTKDTYLQLGVELTQMEGGNTGTIRAQPNWYLHAVAAGYTNQGQIMGAAVGPEGNQQTLELSWVNGIKKIGVRFDHINHNTALAKIVNGERQYWKDIVLTSQLDWSFKKIIFNSQLSYIKSQNYQYLNAKQDNLSLKLGLLYNFN